jgi:hypothetical protein
MNKLLDDEPKDEKIKAGRIIGLVDHDSLLDYLQDVVNKIGENETFMGDFVSSKGSGKIKFSKNI